MSKEEFQIPVENLRNLGPTSVEWLREIGVRTRTDLEQLGPALAYRLVKEKQPKISLNLLWAMEAGLSDKDWRELSAKEKTRLCQEVAEE